MLDLLMVNQKWHIERRNGDDTCVRGIVNVSKTGMGRYIWREEVVTPVRPRGYINGTCTYELCFSNVGLEVYFGDGMNKGGLFQSFKRGQSAHFSQHICGEDTYKTKLYNLSYNRFTVHHDVAGPRKNYCMITNYVRVRAPYKLGKISAA